MKKKIDAFAFRDFSSTKILSRPFFKSFNFTEFGFDSEDDFFSFLLSYDDNSAFMDNSYLVEVQNSLSMVKGSRPTDIQKFFDEVQRLIARLVEFLQLIDCHFNRLRKIQFFYGQRADRKHFKARRKRVDWLLIQYVRIDSEIVHIHACSRRFLTSCEMLLEQIYRKEFGKRLAAARRAAGLTQKDLAEVLGITPTGYSKYEQGRADMPTSALVKTVKVLRCSADKLLGLAD